MFEDVFKLLLPNTNFISSSYNASTYDFEMSDWDYKVVNFSPDILVVVNCLDSLNVVTQKKIPIDIQPNHIHIYKIMIFGVDWT
jgi:hypothetical protein